MTTRGIAVLSVAVFGFGFIAGQLLDDSATANAQARKVYELRTYTTHEGKAQDLAARFRDHTVAIFEKQGMQNVGYWVPQDAPASGNTVIYLLAHDSREAATRSWAGFRDDPDWARTRGETTALVSKVESVFLNPTDFSALQ